MGRAGGKIAGRVLALNGGSVPVRLANNTSDLPKLSKSDVKRETQIIVLEIPIKKCAEAQESTERAVESQRQGESAMSLRAAANLSRSNARARAHFARMFGFSGPCTDPDFMEGIEKVADYYWNKQQRLLIDVAAASDDGQFELDLPEGGK